MHFGADVLPDETTIVEFADPSDQNAPFDTLRYFLAAPRFWVNPGPDGLVVPMESRAASAPSSRAVRPISRVRLMNEYCWDFPLWVTGADDNGPHADHTIVSPELRWRLAAWGAFFQEDYDPFEGWRATAQEIRMHRETGLQLGRDLRDELGDTVAVEVELWETD